MEGRERSGIPQGQIDLTSRFLNESELAGGHHLIVGSVWPTEGQLLSTVTREFAGTVVEVGSWVGVSTLYLVRGLVEAQAGHLYAVDPHTGSILHKRRGVEDTEIYLRENLVRADVEDWVTIIRSTSEEALRTWTSGPVDILFIDGSHKYKDVLIDYYGWFPYTRPGSIIIFHDSDSAGVGRVINEHVRLDKSLVEFDSIRRVKIFRRE